MENENKPNNPSAFPNSDFAFNIEHAGGMTLRDYLAAKAMNGFMHRVYANDTNVFKRLLNFLGIGGGYCDVSYNYKKLSKESYVLADEMLKQREL